MLLPPAIPDGICMAIKGHITVILHDTDLVALDSIAIAIYVAIYSLNKHVLIL